MMTSAAKAKVVVAAVLAILVVIVIVQNTAPVRTTFLFAEVVMPQVALLLITLAIGFTGGVIASEMWAGRKRP